MTSGSRGGLLFLLPLLFGCEEKALNNPSQQVGDEALQAPDERVEVKTEDVLSPAQFSEEDIEHIAAEYLLEQYGADGPWNFGVRTLPSNGGWRVRVRRDHPSNFSGALTLVLSPEGVVVRESPGR